MTNDEFHARRTELANNMAAAGAELLEFMGAAGALAAIPNTAGYVVAGEVAAIRAQLDTVDPQRRMRHGERPTEPLYFGPEAGQRRRWAALITSAGHGILQEYGSRFEHAQPGQEVLEVMEILPGIANKAAEEGELPALPEATHSRFAPDYSADQMHEYARQAIAADRAARPTAHTAGASPILDTVELVELLEAYEMATGDIQARNMRRKDVVEYFKSKFAATNTAGAVPEGWKLVPFEPTEQMIANGFESWPDAFFDKPEDLEAFQAMTGCQQAAHKARMCYGAMLAAAPSAPALAEPANFLLPDDMKALARFYECADDFDSGGHDVPKEAMRRLVEIGVVRPAGPGRHMATSFGDHVMGRDAALGLALPLKTLDERNQELALRSIQEKGG